MKRQLGFTLIELMIALVVAALLANLAVNSYQAQMKKARRSDAKVILTSLAGHQERFYLRNNRYTGDVDDLGGSGGTLTSPEEYYDITVDNTTGCSATGSCFTLTATVADPGLQEDDTDCWTFTISDIGLKTAKNDSGASNETCW